LETLIVGGGRYVANGSLLAFSILLNRAAGTAELGRFSLGLAIAQIGILTVGNAFSAILRRDVAVDTTRAAQYTGNILVLRTASLLFAAPLMLAAAYFYASNDHALLVAVLVVLMAKTFEALGQVIESLYQAVGRFTLFSVTSAGRQVALLVLATIAFWLGGSVVHLYAAYVVASVIGLAANFVIADRCIARISYRIDRTLLIHICREVWPLFLSAFVFLASSRVSYFILAERSGSEAVGTYAAGLNIVSGVSLLSSAIGIVLFPALCKLFRQRPQRLSGLMREMLVGLSMVGVLLAGLLLIAAPWIVRLYGEMPPDATWVLRILALGLLPAFAQPVVGYMFTAIERQAEGLVFATMMLFVSACTYYALVDLAGVRGASVAYAITQLAWVIGAYFWLDLRHLRRLAMEASVAT
jgi:O-antigen/teichoic acid export membrane protein